MPLPRAPSTPPALLALTSRCRRPISSRLQPPPSLATLSSSSAAAAAMASNNSSSSGRTALPAPGDEPSHGIPTLDVSAGADSTLRLDALGPLVVNADGSVARVANWAQMTAPERDNTLRVLGRRNKARLDKLRSADGGGGGGGGEGAAGGDGKA